jgi:hypothetical protein
MAPQMSEQQVLQALGKLSAQGKKKALRKLIRGLGRLDHMIDQNQAKLEAMCRKRGIDFTRLSDIEREELIDRILHGE